MDIAQHKKLAIKAAIAQGLLDKDKPLVALVHKEGIIHSVNELHSAFYDNFRHCFAVKANPYLNILIALREAGMGAEVASETEVELALKAGFSADQIVFDAPVKTLQEIERALSLGIAFNIDNFQELERVKNWLKSNQSNSNIGFRINPQIGAGSVESTSTATLTSKFGIGLKDTGNREKLIKACKDYRWINTLHVHVGSVGCPLELMCEGVKSIDDLAKEINQTIERQQITHMDIGGGLPVDFTQDKDSPSFNQYAQKLRESVPDIFKQYQQVTTEYGRAVIAKNAVTIGRIEYTKTMGGVLIALGHIGVQTLVRTVYEPEDWMRRISAFDATGELKEGNIVKQNIAGPACFSGDLIAKERPLPKLEPNDYIMVHDTGAYHFSNHYQYNALPRLPVYGYEIDDAGNISFELFSLGQSVQDVVDDYS